LLLANSYPSFWNVLWTMIVFFLWIIWLIILFRVIFDIFRRHDISGWGKTGWLIFVIILPFLGVFVYLIAEGGKMANRDVEAAQQQQAQFDTYVRSVASGPAGEIEKAKQLLDNGTITQAEFDSIKAKALAASG
jgi:Short C-terminal domain/Phospholipase_D-nuclease N-terminal